MERKFSVFHINGGIGKHIAATAVARAIKKNHPDRELIVVCAWPAVFVNLDFVDRVYREGNTPYFYQDHIYQKDSILFKHEPYFTTDHIHGNTSLIENWCNLYGLEYNGELPEVEFNLPERQFAEMHWQSDKPILVLQTSGGLFNQDNSLPYKWTRDMPISVIDAVVGEFSPHYNIFQVTRPNAYIPEGTIPVIKEHSTNNLLTLLTKSSKRLLIDSMLQHGAAGLNLPSTVLWIGTNPKVFGYDLHTNIVANQKPEFKLPDSYLFNYSFDGISHECPYKDDSEIFNINEIIDTLKRQGV